MEGPCPRFCSTLGVCVWRGVLSRDGATTLTVLAVQSVRQTMLARDGDSLTLRMLVPVPLCGCIIGKGGAVIRSIMDDSKAQIAVSSQV